MTEQTSHQQTAHEPAAHERNIYLQDVALSEALDTGMPRCKNTACGARSERRPSLWTRRWAG